MADDWRTRLYQAFDSPLRYAAYGAAGLLLALLVGDWKTKESVIATILGVATVIGVAIVVHRLARRHVIAERRKVKPPLDFRD